MFFIRPYCWPLVRFFPVSGQWKYSQWTGWQTRRLIAHCATFYKDEYFQPRPSAASFDASASSSSALAASNYALRDRVARTLGPIVRYADGPRSGQLVAPDIENWFQHDIYQGSPHVVGQWASMHTSDATAWVNTDSLHIGYVADWAKAHADVVAQFVKSNPSIPQPAPSDLAVTFFQNFSNENPGKFPSAMPDTGADGKAVTVIKPVSTGSDIQSIFFDMWRSRSSDRQPAKYSRRHAYHVGVRPRS